MPPADLARIETSERGRDFVAHTTLAKYPGPHVLSATPPDLARIEKSSFGREAVTSALLMKNPVLKHASKDDLAHLKSLNTPRAREALSIMNAGGNAHSFQHAVNFYFAQRKAPSKSEDIVQYIYRTWQMHFGNTQRPQLASIKGRVTTLLRGQQDARGRAGAAAESTFYKVASRSGYDSFWVPQSWSGPTQQ